MGSLDGPGVAARFNNPCCVAVDSAGSVYVADSGNHTIRKITAAGVVTTLAGTAGMYGSTDGAGAAARFDDPLGVAVDSAGNVYVADDLNSTIRKITAAGVVTTLAGAAGLRGSADGAGAAARFNRPNHVAVDSAGNVYVTDAGNFIVRMVTADGIVTTLAGTAGLQGNADGTGAAARFSSVTGVAVDGAGNIYVSDGGNSTIRKITAAGVVTTLAGTPGVQGSADGAGNAASFGGPVGMAVDGAGNIYVTDRGNSTIRKVTAAGVVTTVAGTPGMPGSADGASAAASFNNPSDVAVDSAGNLYVADDLNSTIRKITAAGVVTTWAGTLAIAGSTDGKGAAARFNAPWGVMADRTGTVYVADFHILRKVTAAGDVTTLAGIAASFNRLHGVAVDGAGNVYVADQNNHTLREVTAAGVVTTLAGAAGMPGSTDGAGAAARFNAPAGVAVDGAGNIYVADQNNQTIRKLTPTGVATTLAGAAGMPGSADGVGAAARFRTPDGVAVDGTGNLYVADKENHIIRKITPAGDVTTLAGAAGIPGSADGVRDTARFFFPTGVVVDSAGNVYVADQGNSTIRKVATDGTTTTIAGTPGVKGIGLGTMPNLASPAGLAIIGDSIVISDPNAILLLRHGVQLR